MHYYYTVYEAATDALLAQGTAAECAKTLEFASLHSFYSTASLVAQGKNKKYVIVKNRIDRPGQRRIEVESSAGVISAEVVDIPGAEGIRLMLLAGVGEQVSELALLQVVRTHGTERSLLRLTAWPGRNGEAHTLIFSPELRGAPYE